MTLPKGVLGVVLTLERYQELLEAAEHRNDRELSTRQASEELGRGRRWWARAANDGEIEGVYRDPVSGHWRLPESSCRQHLERIRDKALGRRRQRGPWKAVGDRTEDLPGRQVLEGRSETVGRPEDRAPESVVAWLAGDGRADRAQGGG